MIIRLGFFLRTSESKNIYRLLRIKIFRIYYVQGRGQF